MGHTRHLLPHESLNTQPKPDYKGDDYICKDRINKFQMMHQRERDESHIETHLVDEETATQISSGSELKGRTHTVKAKLHVPLANTNKSSPKFSTQHKIIALDT